MPSRSYHDEGGEKVADREVLERLRGLAIPPAWKDVWICADPWGHLQATGIDAAGRKQYLYHPSWRERRDQEKFDRMVRFARCLPKLRRRIGSDLEGSEDSTRERVLACAVRLLDVGLFRVGSEQYAGDAHGVGLATVSKEHVSIRGAANGVRLSRERRVATSAGHPGSAHWGFGAFAQAPAVARRAYIDPRVFDRYASGANVADALKGLGELETIDGRKRAKLERAELLSD